MKTRLLFTLIIALTLLASACGGTTSKGTPIKIGMIYNMTGAQASLDVPSANGAKLAVKEINTAGGVLGRQLELVSYDGKTDAAQMAMQPRN